MNALIIFSLLITLMLTGMPISIALGLTVLTFLFVLTSVPIEAVALKLFTGIESLRTETSSPESSVTTRSGACSPTLTSTCFTAPRTASIIRCC